MKRIVLLRLILVILTITGCSAGPTSNFEVYIDKDCTQIMDATHPMQGVASADGTSQTATVFVQNTSSKNITVKGALNVTRAIPGVSLVSYPVTISPKQVKPVTVTLTMNNYFPDEANRVSIVFEEVKD